MQKFHLMPLIFLIALNSASAQQAFTSSGGVVLANSGSIAYVAGQMTNQTTEQHHFGVLQVFETTSDVLGVSDLSHYEIVVYPNPTTQYLQVEDKSQNAEPINYQIIDLQGRVVLKGQLLNNQPTIDVTSLARHQYQLLLLSENNLIKTFKIVKK